MLLGDSAYEHFSQTCSNFHRVFQTSTIRDQPHTDCPSCRSVGTLRADGPAGPTHRPQVNPVTPPTGTTMATGSHQQSWWLKVKCGGCKYTGRIKVHRSDETRNCAWCGGVDTLELLDPWTKEPDRFPLAMQAHFAIPFSRVGTPQEITARQSKIGNRASCQQCSKYLEDSHYVCNCGHRDCGTPSCQEEHRDQCTLPRSSAQDPSHNAQVLDGLRNLDRSIAAGSQSPVHFSDMMLDAGDALSSPSAQTIGSFTDSITSAHQIGNFIPAPGGQRLGFPDTLAGPGASCYEPKQRLGPKDWGSAWVTAPDRYGSDGQLLGPVLRFHFPS